MEKQTEATEKATSEKEENAAPVKTAETPGGAPHQHKHRQLLYVTAGILAILLLIGLLWHKQVGDLWADLFGEPAPAASTATSLNSEPGLGGTGGAAGTATQRNNRATTQDSAKTTTTTTTTTTTSGPETPPGDDGASSQTSNLLTLATNAKPGLNRDQLIALAGGQGPTSCTDIGLANLVQQSVCTWTADGKSVVVTLQNGVVTGLPIKLGF